MILPLVLLALPSAHAVDRAILKKAGEIVLKKGDTSVNIVETTVSDEKVSVTVTTGAIVTNHKVLCRSYPAGELSLVMIPTLNEGWMIATAMIPLEKSFVSAAASDYNLDGLVDEALDPMTGQPIKLPEGKAQEMFDKIVTCAVRVEG